VRAPRGARRDTDFALADLRFEALERECPVLGAAIEQKVHGELVRRDEHVAGTIDAARALIGRRECDADGCRALGGQQAGLLQR
jgi:hypothetical protein